MTKAEQTSFWEGDFGNDYTDRNAIRAEDRCNFFKQIIEKCRGLESVLELGANKGHNLSALHMLAPQLSLTGVELNRKACNQMASIGGLNAICSTIQDFKPVETFDLVFTCGVMIHLPPADLPVVYQKMFDLSRRYVMINEYFNPDPVEIKYRGHSERLFKRDFGGEFLDLAANRVKLVDYGFLWKRVEPTWDNTTWWLFEKK
ncbi:MAG: pseudaminic acid biosynthesis-associated methylase [Candidatus Riflebacteria bacterium]